jgi:ABC-type antimicrobial peptide transport system permease subunit
MSTLQIEAYELLKQKPGQQEANLFIEYIENKVDKQVENQTKILATTKDLLSTREDLIKEIAGVKSDLHKTIYLVGLIQFLAIVGSVLGIVNFMLK